MKQEPAEALFIPILFFLFFLRSSGHFGLFEYSNRGLFIFFITQPKAVFTGIFVIVNNTISPYLCG